MQVACTVGEAEILVQQHQRVLRVLRLRADGMKSLSPATQTEASLEFRSAVRLCSGMYELHVP